MIRQLRGTTVHTSEAAITLLTNGIGYLVYTPQPHTFSIDSDVTLHTHLAVRETALDLYGFHTPEELELFELLLTVPKVGPKSALAVMTQADPATIAHAVTTEDAGYLHKTAGIGKKTAEKIVVELKDKLPATLAAAAIEATTGPEPTFASDAIDALVALGYPQADARHIILNLPPEITSVNEAVKAALTKLNTTD